MKKSLVALAVLGTIAGSAAAQSSVTLFGLVDLTTRYTKANGQSLSKLSNDGSSSSRLGVRGVEDLGGGLKAGFWLESGLAADTGAAGGNVGNAPAAGAPVSTFWNRRSTVSLMGDFGEVRLGRDKTAVNLTMDDFDPYGDVGQGAMYNTYSVLGSGATSFGSSTVNRNNNQVIYILPSNLGGFYGQVNVAAGEGVSTPGSGSQKQYSGRVGYKDAALNVAGSYAETDITTGKLKVSNLDVSYDFGMVKPVATWTQIKFGAYQQSNYTLAATAPVGPGLIEASYTDSQANDAAKAAKLGGKAQHFSLGYIYSLSKRTSVYANVSEIKNDSLSKIALADTVAINNGGGSGSVDVGIKHSF